MSFNENGPAAPARAPGATKSLHHQHTAPAAPAQAPRRHVRAGDNDRRQTDLMKALVPLDQLRPTTSGRYLIKGVLDRGALSLMFGPSNVGKSFFALDLCAHVSAGITWHGHRVADGVGPAVYIAAEGAAAFGNRVAALRIAKPEVADQAAAAGMAVLRSSVDLCGPGDAAQIIQLLSDHMAVQPALIVVDTLARSMGRGNENDGRDMGAVAASCALIQEATGAHVMLVHHTGKDAAKGARGHYSLHAAIDSEIELKLDDKASKRARAEFSKQREHDIVPSIHFALRRVEIGRDEDGDPVTSAVIEAADPAPRESRGALANNAQKQAGADGRAIAAIPLLPTGTFSASDAVPALTSAGLISNSDPRSARESARNVLKRLAGIGRVTMETGGKFKVSNGGGHHAG